MMNSEWFHFKVLNRDNLILSVTTALGWLIALLIAIIHLERARRDNQTAKQFEIKKRLKIETFKEMKSNNRAKEGIKIW